jgi:hypothetical protein
MKKSQVLSGTIPCTVLNNFVWALIALPIYTIFRFQCVGGGETRGHGELTVASLDEINIRLGHLLMPHALPELDRTLY